MPPNNSAENNPLSIQNFEHTSKMSTVLSSNSRAFHRTDLAETSTSPSIHSNGIHGMNVAEDPPQFNYERERLKSFEDWPVSFLTPSVMAAAGFYFLKREDIVRCAFCGVEVGSWVEGDDPMQDHERWSPSCRFVRKLPVGNVPLNNTSSNNNSTTDVPKENGYDTCGRIEFRPECGLSINSKENPLPPLEKLGIHKSRAPSFPHYNTMDSRLRSYELWPIALKLKPNTLSEAGFFYTGKGDQTICFHCGGGLKDWEESDEPWVEHARWFFKCNFVLMMKGKEFIDEVCGRKATKGKSKSEENINLSGSSCSSSTCKQELEMETSQKNDNKNAAGKSEHTSLCKICFTDEVGVVFLPCGHLVACVKCALSLTTCAKPPTTVRFFNRVEYYTVHGPDATFTAKQVFKSSAPIKNIGSGENSLESLTINKAQFEAFLRELLLVKHYRVEVYTKPSKASNNLWSLEYKGSPGNLSQFEDLLFSNSDQLTGSAIIAVRPVPNAKTKTVGVALVDTVEHTFSVCEFADDDYYSNLEGLLVQQAPRECLLPSENNADIENIRKIIERSGLLVTTRKRSEFNHEDTMQDLNRLVKFEDGQQQSVNALSQSVLTTAMSCLGAIERYLELCNNQENFNQFKLQSLEHERFVHLDSAAVAALNLVPPPGTTPAPHLRHHSLLGLLDHCRTPHGHRLIAQWVKQPLRDLAAISERHDIVEVLTQDTELRQALNEDHLRRIPDLQALAKRLQRKKATLQDCYRIYQALQRFPALLEVLQNNSHPTLEALITAPIKEFFADTEKLQEMIESTLDLSLVDKGEYLVKPEFDDDLKELRNKMDLYEEDINKVFNEASRELKLDPGKTIKLESNSQYGFYFRVTLKEEKMIRNMHNFVQLDANKSGLRFRNQELTDLNSDYQEAKNEYTKYQESIVSEVINIAAGYSGTLKSLSHMIAQLDVFVSLALVAVNAPIPYVRPVMRDQSAGVFSLTQARHPCLEMQDSVSYIANDVHFKQGECTFYMVTGPNMGGKSTYIRSAGVVALLAHIGSLVPCEAAEMSVLESILARVGASDSQVKGMSTFMVEMVETASIIRTATSNSLVIIDELGRGTSTFEGCGIAWAIAEHLAETAKAFTLFATHFHELTRLSETVSTLANQHVTAVTEEDALTLLYQVRPGACDQSFGIHVAQMARFPPPVIEDAKRKLAELEDYQSMIVAESDAKKRKIIQEGEMIMEEMLQKFKNLDANGLSDSEIAEAVAKLKNEALERNNPYIQALLCKA